MTTQEAINAVHKISSNTPHNGYTRSSDTIELVYRILRDHEAQLKAKDEEIERLKAGIKQWQKLFRSIKDIK